MIRLPQQRRRANSAASVLILLLVLLTTGCGGGGGSTSGRVASNIQRLVATADEVAEYNNIWGKIPTAGQQRRQSAILDDATSQGLTALRSTPTRTASEQFLDLYQSTSADIVTLVGHNDGGIFRFPDASWVDLREVGGDGGPIIALISCDSAVYASGQAVGLPTPVTIELAVDVEQRFVTKVGALQALPSVAEAERLLVEALSEAADARAERFVYMTLTGVGSGVVAGISIHEVVT